MKRILVVDDNILMRKLIINLFHREDIAFDEACDGREGLDKLSEIQYDLIITDIVMPKMEGIEMILEVKRKHPGIQIIAISGSEPFYLFMAKKLGVKAIFTKPLNHSDFSATIRGILQLPGYITKAS